MRRSLHPVHLRSQRLPSDSCSCSLGPLQDYLARSLLVDHCPVIKEFPPPSNVCFPFHRVEAYHAPSHPLVDRLPLVPTVATRESGSPPLNGEGTNRLPASSSAASSRLIDAHRLPLRPCSKHSIPAIPHHCQKSLLLSSVPPSFSSSLLSPSSSVPSPSYTHGFSIQQPLSHSILPHHHHGLLSQL